MKCRYIHIIACTVVLSGTSLFVSQLQAVPGVLNADLRETSDLIQEKDTVRHGKLPKEYQSLKNQSSRNKWTKRLFSLLVRESSPPDENKEKRSLADEFKEYEGKIIRNIEVFVLAPFGTDINDPGYEVEDLNVFNNLHAKTRRSTIKNLAQFRRGDPLNPALMAASEAEIRNAGYINDARIIVKPAEYENDSVDVNIIVRDRWSIGVELHRLSSSRVNIEMFDKNILGSGSRVGLNFIYSSLYDRKFGLGLNYLYENIARTNIDLEGNYIDDIRSSDLSLSVTRKLQPKLNYFGEISFSKQTFNPDRMRWDSIAPDKNRTFSVAGGRAFTLSDHDAIRRFVVSFRYRIKWPEYSNSHYQSLIKDILIPYKYTKNQMWLAQVSLYQNSYRREYLVYNFGTTENIAQGYNFSAQFGYSKFNYLRDALYGSFSASYGTSRFLRGNIYATTSISSFFHKNEPFGGVYRLHTRYFTPLMKLSRMRFRQFITVDYSKILNPDRYFGDRLYMGQNTTLRVRNWRHGQVGTEQLLIKSETDIFSNYEVAGFRFLFYNFLDVGWITSRGNLFGNDNFNYGIGVGIRLRNNFIILNTIDLKIGVYPKLNQSGFNSFFQVRSSTPDIPPNFTPSIPEEIILER